MATRGSYVHISMGELSGNPDNISFMQFSTKIDGFEQKDSQGFENSYNSYEQYPLEKFFIFTIYQNYTLALTIQFLAFTSGLTWLISFNTLLQIRETLTKIHCIKFNIWTQISFSYSFAISLHLPPFWHKETFFIQMFLSRSIKAYLYPNMINFDGVHFSERRSEEVVSFFWWSVYLLEFCLADIFLGWAEVVLLHIWVVLLQLQRNEKHK